MSELKAVFINETTGELEFLGDFVDTSHEVELSSEVEIVSIEEANSKTSTTTTTQSITKPLQTSQLATTQYHQQQGGGGSQQSNNIRSAPSLLRKRNVGQQQYHHQQITSSNSTVTSQNNTRSNSSGQNTVVEYIPIQNVLGDTSSQSTSSSSSTSFNFHHHHHHGASNLPPASAQFIRAVEELKCETTGSGGEGTQLLVYNSVDNNFDIIPPDNIQLRLCQVVDEDDQQQQQHQGFRIEEGDDSSGEEVLGHQINTIYICEEQPNFIQDSEYPNIQIVEELPMPMLQDAEGNVYELEDYQTGEYTFVDSLNGSNGTIFSTTTTGVSGGSSSSNNNIGYPLNVKRRKKSSSSTSTKEKINKDGTTGKVSKRPINELKCLETGCAFSGVNVAELRKHLNTIHGMHFDEETIQFASEKDFKTWREHYERERMVSFIFRGGTKKISRDQAVTYLICHRSGHYKPTMKDQSLRKRKMKPQGSCKMNGYCTAGIKLLKNLDTGEVKCEICHTHYGHPLNNDAIPHLRVNNTLRKIIWTKFQQGLTFNQVVQYLHHNPDQLDGLRLLDRRAVRNIYDKFKKNPTKSFLDEDYDNDDTLSPSTYITDGNNIMTNSNGTHESSFRSTDIEVCLEDEKPTTGSVVEVHFEFPSEAISTHLENDNTIIIHEESTDNNDDSSSLDDHNHQNNINNNINCTSTTTTFIDSNNTNNGDNNNMDIQTFTVYGSTQSLNDQMSTILESNNSTNTNNNNNINCNVNLTTSEIEHQQQTEEILLLETRNVEEEENEPLIAVELGVEENILPEPDKPIIIVNIPKKRGRPKKVQNSPTTTNKLETDDSEQQHSEFQDSIFLSPQSSTNNNNTTTTTPTFNTRTRTDSHSQGSTSPIRRSTRERKRKTFYDEDDENSSSSTSSVSHSPASTSSPSLKTQQSSVLNIKSEPVDNTSSTNIDEEKNTSHQQPKVKSSSLTKISTTITIKQKNSKITKQQHQDDEEEEQDKSIPPKLLKFDNINSSRKNSKVSSSSSLLPSSNSSQVRQQLDDSQPPVLEKIDNISQTKKQMENMNVDGNKRQKNNNDHHHHHTKESDKNKNIVQDSSSISSSITTLSSPLQNELPPNLSSDLEVDEVVSNITANVKAVKKGNVVKRMNIKGKVITSSVTTNTTLPTINNISSSSSSIKNNTTTNITRTTQNKNKNNNSTIKDIKGNVKPTRASSSTNALSTINIPIQDCISEDVKTAIRNLLDHGESGPTILMYKRFGLTIPEYGPQYDDFHKEDFCLIIQTPTQRELMQMFGDIIHLDGHKGRQKDLKLMFIMVLDEFREAIPVAWLISNVNDDRMVKIFLRVLHQHVGEIETRYFMAPIHSNYAQIWSSTFTSSSSLENGQDESVQYQPQMILNEEDTKRDMRIEVADAFSDSNTRKVLNTLMNDMIYAVDQESLDCIYNNMEEYLTTQHGQEKTNDFMEHFSQNWLTKTKEWTLIHRIGAPVNTLYASESFGKLKKFIAFKGTKILSSVIDPVLKIGYDKCFSRSKRIFKGDQKLMKVMEEIELYHTQSTQIPSNCFHPKNKGYTPRILTDIVSNGDPLQQRIQKQERSESNGDNDNDEHLIGGGVRNNIWGVYDPEKNIEYTVVDLQSPCRCKYICSKCNICMHNYICSCPVSQIEHLFCKHIHFVHSQIQLRDSKIKWIQASTTGTGSNFHLVDNDTDIETIVFVSQHSLR